jgi:hypothetical protein
MNRIADLRALVAPRPEPGYPTPWRVAETRGDKRVVVCAEGHYTCEAPTDEAAEIIAEAVNVWVDESGELCRQTEEQLEAVNAAAVELKVKNGRLRAELEFILARLEAERNHVYPRCWGISSNALALYAIRRGRRPARSEFPSDKDDLGACERTYEMAPPHLQERMLPVLEEFRAAVRNPE